MTYEQWQLQHCPKIKNPIWAGNQRPLLLQTLITKTAKTLKTPSIRHRSDTFVSDRYLIDVDMRWEQSPNSWPFGIKIRLMARQADSSKIIHPILKKAGHIELSCPQIDLSRYSGVNDDVMTLKHFPHYWSFVMWIPSQGTSNTELWFCCCHAG